MFNVEATFLSLSSAEEALRESLWNLFVDFKKSGRLLTVKIDGEHDARYALLTFRKSDDVEKALLFAPTKSISGVRLKAELYDASTPGKHVERYRTCNSTHACSSIILENDDVDLVKRSICTDPDIDEYSVKATRTLYIGNLQSEISYNELRETYSAYGDIIVRLRHQRSALYQSTLVLLTCRNWKSSGKLNLNTNYRLPLFSMQTSRAWSKR